MTRRIPAGLAIIALAATAQLGGQTRQAAPPDPGREFPSGEYVLAEKVRESILSRRAEEALRTAPADASTIGVLFDAKRFEDAFQSVEAATRGPLDNLVESMEVLGQKLGLVRDEMRLSYAERVRAIIASVRSRLVTLAREDAAGLAWTLVRIDFEQDQIAGKPNRSSALAVAYLDEYRGTKAALMAEVSVIDDGFDLQRKIASLDAFWRAHPGSEAGARALHQKGYQLAFNTVMSGTQLLESDPTERFLQVVAIVNELTSGRYPECEWVRQAPQLISGFYTPSDPAPAYQPGNVDRLIAAYQQFVRKYFATEAEAAYGVGYVITSRIPNLQALQGIGRTSSIDKSLADLLANGADKRAIELFRAQSLANAATGGPEADRALLQTRADMALTTLASSGTDFASRKAAALLANMWMYQREYARALPVYETYASRFPSSPFAWVAQIRAGQCLVELDELPRAAVAFEAAASSAPDEPLSLVIGSALAAQTYDALGQFDRSLPLYRRALAAWKPAYGRNLTPDLMQASRPAPATGESTSPVDVTKQRLADRVASLERNLNTPLGPLLERAATQIDARRFTDARASLAAAAKQASSTDEQAAVRRLDHRAQLEMAMELVAVGGAKTDVLGGLKILEALAPESFDTSVGFAGLARAALIFRNGTEADARMVMTSTLDAWRDRQRILRVTKPSTALAAEIAAVRTAIIRPAGTFELQLQNSWTAFRVPSTGYAAVNPEVEVIESNGSTSRLTIYQDFPGLTNVVFWTTDETAFARRLGVTLGGTGALATANADVRRFWNSAFAISEENVSGWVVETYPKVVSIRFMDSARTKATVTFVASSYSGGTMAMEKQNGVWQAVKLLNFWMS